MTSPTELLEPSFQNLIDAIEQASELPDERRRHWVCSSAANREMAGPAHNIGSGTVDRRYGFPSANCTTRVSASGQKPWRTTRPT